MISATIAGNLGADAEMSSTSKGGSVLRFRVASSVKRGDKETTTWVGCSWFGKRAEGVAKHLVKGVSVVVSGELTTTEKDGKTYVNLDVSGLKLMGSRGAGGPRPETPRELERDKPRDEDDGDLPF
jgi:single-strand DNA-binding protein